MNPALRHLAPLVPVPEPRCLSNIADYRSLADVRCDGPARPAGNSGRAQLVGFPGPKSWTDNRGADTSGLARGRQMNRIGILLLAGAMALAGDIPGGFPFRSVGAAENASANKTETVRPLRSILRSAGGPAETKSVKHTAEPQTDQAVPHAPGTQGPAAQAPTHAGDNPGPPAPSPSGLTHAGKSVRPAPAATGKWLAPRATGKWTAPSANAPRNLIETTAGHVRTTPDAKSTASGPIRPTGPSPQVTGLSRRRSECPSPPGLPPCRPARRSARHPLPRPRPPAGPPMPTPSRVRWSWYLTSPSGTIATVAGRTLVQADACVTVGTVSLAVSTRATPPAQRWLPPRGTTTMYPPKWRRALATGQVLEGIAPLGIKLGGWVDQSFTANADSPTNRFNGPVTFTDRANEYLLNQVYLYAERTTNTEDYLFDVGGRFDLLYGTDARFTLAEGLDDKIVSEDASRFYKLSLPQLYAEVAVDRLAVQMGRFYTILGYESVICAQNFFVSHSYSMQYAEPLTHTGLLARYGGPCGLTWLGGFTRGWNNWEDNNDDLDVIAGVNWTSCDNRQSVSAAVTSGPQDDLGRNDRTVTSLVIQQAFNSWVSYVFDGNVGYENGTAGQRDAEWYGFVNYLIADINPCWSFGVRQEWFSDDDGVRVTGHSVPGGASVLLPAGHWQELAVGVNYRPGDNWLVRSEARWDWADPLIDIAGGPFDDDHRRSQFLCAVDLIIGF